MLKDIRISYSKNIYILLEAILPLAAGGIIYILLRTDSLLMYRWFDYLNISGFIYMLRNSVNIIPHENLKIIINTLPNGLWCFSYTAFLLIIWKNIISIRNIFYFIIIPFIGIISEFLQLVGIMRGTFDYFDVLAYSIGALLPLIIHFKKIKIFTV